MRIEPGSTKRNLEEATKAQRTAIVDEEERRRRTREKVRRFRANQADGERQAELDTNRYQHQQARSNQTDEERQAERDTDRHQHQQARSNQTDGERQAHRDATRHHIQQLRSNQTDGERQAERDTDRWRKQQRRMWARARLERDHIGPEIPTGALTHNGARPVACPLIKVAQFQWHGVCGNWPFEMPTLLGRCR